MSSCASGCEDLEEAGKLAALPGNGHTWTVHVLNSGKVDEQRFTAELGRMFHTPVEVLELPKVDRTSLGLLPSRFVFKHQILPLGTTENAVCASLLTMSSITWRAASPASSSPGKKIEWVLVPRSQLLRAIKTLYGVGAETFEELLQMSDRTADSGDERFEAMDLDADDPEASVVKFVNQIIREAIAERATDIHVEPLENDLRIRYRIDGILHEVAVPPQLRLLQSAIISRLKVMARMDIAEKRLPQDGRINLSRGHEANIDVRVSTIPTVNGESISLRLLTREEQQFGFERLDLSDETGRYRPHPAGAAERHRARDRTDRFREIDLALLVPEQHQFRAAPHHHHRGAGRIPAARRLANRCEAGDRANICARAAAHSAAGSERHHGGRNP